MALGSFSCIVILFSGSTFHMSFCFSTLIHLLKHFYSCLTPQLFPRNHNWNNIAWGCLQGHCIIILTVQSCTELLDVKLVLFSPFSKRQIVNYRPKCEEIVGSSFAFFHLWANSNSPRLHPECICLQSSVYVGPAPSWFFARIEILGSIITS